MTFFEKRVEKTVEQEHFTAGIDQIVIDDKLVRLGVGGPIKEKGV